MAGGRIRIRKYEAVPGCGSFEVRFSDGRESNFSIGTICCRRLRPEILTREAALDQVKTFARALRDGEG